MTQTNKSQRYTKEMIAQRAAQRKAMKRRKTDCTIGFGNENTGSDGTPVGINTRLQPLYQDKPHANSTYVQYPNRSFTGSLESYQYGAEKEVLILQRNKRPPTKAIVMHHLKELSVADIVAYRSKIFRILRREGIQAVVAIELSRTRPKTGKPNNRVHYHILTDDKGSGQRSEEELRDIFKKACEDSGLDKKDFRIDYKKVDDGEWYFDYFTKFDRKSKDKYKNDGGYKNKENDGDWKRVLLFRQGLRLHKFYQIGKWFKKSKALLWKEIQAIMRTKAQS